AVRRFQAFKIDGDVRHAKFVPQPRHASNADFSLRAAGKSSYKMRLLRMGRGMNIGIVLPNWIGDVVMATPALRAVRQHFAGAHLVGIMRPYVGEVLAGTTWLDEQIVYSIKKRPRTLQIWH